MNKNYKRGLIIVGVLLLLPVIIVQIFFGREMEFVSYQFANEYLRFIGSLISITFSFYLINIFWRDHETENTINHAKNILLNYTIRIINVTDKIFQLLSVVYNESQFSESQKRDVEISRLIEKVQKVSLAIENTPFDNRAFKDSVFTSVYIDSIWKDLLPLVERLSLFKNFRSNYEDFWSTLSELKSIAEKICEEIS
jgi:hypothetical protein